MENLEASEIILGVDTHLDVHVGVVIDAAGCVMGALAVGTNHVRGDRMQKAKPVDIRDAIAVPVEVWMLGEYLDARADDEEQKKTRSGSALPAAVVGSRCGPRPSARSLRLDLSRSCEAAWTVRRLRHGLETRGCLGPCAGAQTVVRAGLTVGSSRTFHGSQSSHGEHHEVPPPNARSRCQRQAQPVSALLGTLRRSV